MHFLESTVFSEKVNNQLAPRVNLDKEDIAVGTDGTNLNPHGT